MFKTYETSIIIFIVALLTSDGSKIYDTNIVFTTGVGGHRPSTNIIARSPGDHALNDNFYDEQRRGRHIFYMQWYVAT